MIFKPCAKKRVNVWEDCNRNDMSTKPTHIPHKTMAKVFVTCSMHDSLREETKFLILSEEEHEEFAMLPMTQNAIVKIRLNETDKSYDVSMGPTREVFDALFFHTRNKLAVRPFFFNDGKPKRYTPYSQRTSTRREHQQKKAKWDFYAESKSPSGEIQTTLLTVNHTPNTWGEFKRMVTNAWNLWGNKKKHMPMRVTTQSDTESD